jgi:hypothetical protein
MLTSKKTSIGNNIDWKNRWHGQNVDNKKSWLEKTLNKKRLTMGRKDRKEKNVEFIYLRIEQILIFFKWHCIFYHSTLCLIRLLLYMQHNFQSTFFTCRHCASVGIYYIRHYFQLTLFTFLHYVPFDVHYLRSDVLLLFTIRCFLPWNIFPVHLLSHSTFCPSTFVYRRRFFTSTFCRWIAAGPPQLSNLLGPCS